MRIARVARAGVLAGTLAMALASAAAVACSPRASADPTRTAATPDTAGLLVAMTPVRAPMQLPAQLYVEHDAAIVARSTGVVDSVMAELGTHVTAGTLLAKLESTDQELAAAQADASYENMGRLVARARVMTKAGGTTVADSEQVEFQYKQAELARRKAHRDLALARIVAPFSGVVTARYARPGRFVSEGDTLFRVTESSPLLARVRVPEGSATALGVGDQATVVGVSGTTSRAVVLHAAPAFDAASGTREVVLRLTGGAAFLPGATVTVRLGDQQRQAVTVPREAVSPDGYVLVMQNGRTSLRSVTVGGDVGGGRVEVLSGLSAGERVAKTATR
jgi:RND family efflux transporter MFP subunit